MPLMSEITALRASMEEHARSKSKAEAPSPKPNEPADDIAGEPTSIDTLLKTMSETIEELGQDVDAYPRLTALTGFAIGLALGMAISPRGR